MTTAPDAFYVSTTSLVRLPNTGEIVPQYTPLRICEIHGDGSCLVQYYGETFTIQRQDLDIAKVDKCSRKKGRRPTSPNW